MMSVAIDQTKMRRAVPRPPAAPRKASPVLIGALGCAGIVGLALGANALLSQVAGPRPASAPIGRVAAAWPDLKDGVPALAPSAPARPSPASVAAAPPSARSLPRIEVAALVPAPQPVATLVPAKAAARVAPSAAETTRALAAAAPTAFAALPSPPRRKPAPKASSTAAQAEPAAIPAGAAEEAEGEGAFSRTIAEGVAAIGEAVKSLPGRF